MADRADLDFTYSQIDRIFRLSLGELADFSGAKYDGDFSLTLEQAQNRKHEYVAEQIGIDPGRRILDLGCGWGPLLAFIRRRGAAGVGVTLSRAQVRSCRRHGLDVHLRDARDVTGETFGTFDGVASLGAFEHFCSPDDYRAGRQETIYRELFAGVAGVVPDGRPVLPPDDGVRAKHDPLEELAGVDPPRRGTPTRGTSRSWDASSRALSCHSAKVRSCAAPSRTSAFARASAADSTTSRRSASGGGGLRSRGLRKALVKLRLLPRWLTSADFRLAFTSGVSANSVCFERELLDHYRLVFERTS